MNADRTAQKVASRFRQAYGDSPEAEAVLNDPTYKAAKDKHEKALDLFHKASRLYKDAMELAVRSDLPPEARKRIKDTYMRTADSLYEKFTTWGDDFYVIDNMILRHFGD